MQPYFDEYAKLSPTEQNEYGNKYQYAALYMAADALVRQDRIVEYIKQLSIGQNALAGQVAPTPEQKLMLDMNRHFARQDQELQDKLDQQDRHENQHDQQE
jgi:hypothetical protein